MAKQTLPTRACGVVAGPLYVMVTLAQALTRDGFDLRQHRFSWLTAGDLGWIAAPAWREPLVPSRPPLRRLYGP